MIDMEKTDKKKQKNKLVSRLVTLFLIFTIALCLFVVVQVLSRGYASFGGFSLFRVATGSMEPEIPEKALIITKYEGIEKIEVRDVICFRAQSPGMIGKTITHRVIERMEVDGKIYLRTQGDANPIADSYYVTEEILVGTVVWCSGSGDFFSKFISFFTNKIGFLALVAFPCLLIAGVILRDCVKNIKGDLKKVLEEMATAETQQAKEETDKEQQDKEPREGNSSSETVSQEDYEEMCARIRAELIEEMKQENGRE